MTDDPRNLRETAADLRTLARTLTSYLGEPVADNDIDWARIAVAIDERMTELHLTHKAAIDLTEPRVSPVTFRKLLRPERAAAEPPRRITMIAVSEALGWGPDGLFRIGAGESREAIQQEISAADDDADLGGMLTRIAGQLGAVVAQLDLVVDEQTQANKRLDQVVTRLDRLERQRAAVNGS